MNRSEVVKILDLISSQIKGFEYEDEVIDTWSNVLSSYDFNDVLKSLEISLKKDEFQRTPPTVYYLIKGLTPVDNKVNYKKMVVSCLRCGKSFNELEKLKEHENKCRSIDYVIFQTNKWLNKKLTRKELLLMPSDEFNDRYEKLLKYIYNHTKDNQEKKIIGFIFNPPENEESKRLLNLM